MFALDSKLSPHRALVLGGASGLGLLLFGAVYMATQSHISLQHFNLLDWTSPTPPPDPDECFKAKGDVETSHYLDGQYDGARTEARTPADDAHITKEQAEEARHRTRMCRKYGHTSPYGDH